MDGKSGGNQQRKLLRSRWISHSSCPWTYASVLLVCLSICLPVCVSLVRVICLLNCYYICSSLSLFLNFYDRVPMNMYPCLSAYLISVSLNVCPSLPAYLVSVPMNICLCLSVSLLTHLPLSLSLSLSMSVANRGTIHPSVYSENILQNLRLRTSIYLIWIYKYANISTNSLYDN